MTNEMKARITKAVNEVYDMTDMPGIYTCERDVVLTIPDYFGDMRDETIKITRSRLKDDLTYKLYTEHDYKPLLTVFGCWPTEFVADIFIRAMEHFYNCY